MNEKIRAPRLQMISEDGQNFGTVTRMRSIKACQKWRDWI